MAIDPITTNDTPNAGREKINTNFAQLGGALEVVATNAYTPVLADVGKLKQINDNVSVVVTLPPNASVPFAINDKIAWVRGRDGTFTFAGGAGVTIQSPQGNKSLAYTWSTAVTTYLGNNVWLLSGDLTA